MLQVRLLGELEVELDGAAISSPVSQRPWALFAHIALAPRPIARADLAARFWPDVLDASARASLRSALWVLRRELGDGLVIDRDRVRLNDAQVDVREFARLAAAGQPEQALALCRGELLEGLDDEWALAARQRHRDRVIELMESIAADCERGDDPRGALEWTRRQADHGPLDEEVHRRLIGRLVAVGDRAGAVRAHHSFCERLRRELGVAPSPLTRAAAEQLRSEVPAPASGPAHGVPLPPLPLVGRDRELAALQGAWDRARGGGGGAVLVAGEAGIGKTRLVTELRRRASSAGAVTAGCAALDLGGTAPLSLWAELIRDLLPALPAPPADAAWPDDLGLLVAELPDHFGRARRDRASVSPDLERTRLFEAVVALLAWAARERPVLLLLEDIHTADAPSLELAGYAARRAAALPVLLVLSRRERPQSADADQIEAALRARGLLALELRLGPLPPASLAKLARSSERLSEPQVQQVVETADGNALLAVETARALASGVGEVAPSLRGGVRATLNRLDGSTRSLTELLAVAGRAIEPAELGELSIEGAEDAAAAALDTGIVIATDGRLGFRHALLREAVYAEIAEPRRPGLHQRWAAAALSAEPATGVRRAAEAARHLRMARRDREAVEQLLRAAADARAVAALAQAAAYLIEAAEIDAGRPELWLELGEVEGWRARRDEAEGAFDRALALLEDAPPLERARASLRRARVYHGTICVPRLVLENSRRAIELLDETAEPAPEERREALAAWAWAEAAAGSLEEADRLVAELRSVHVGGDAETYDVGHAQGLALMRRGDFRAAYAPSIAAGEAAERLGRLDLTYGCFANAAGAAAATGDYAQALEFLELALTVEGNGLQGVEAYIHAARSWVLIRLGRLDEARMATETERALADEVGQPELVAMACQDGGLVALEAADYELSASLLADALVDGAPISRAATRLARAEALTRCGKLEEAAAEIRATVLEPVRPSDFPETLVPRLARVQGLLAQARGDTEQAERRLRESVASWERSVAPARVAASLTTALADLGRPVVGLVEPERELARARRDLEGLINSQEGSSHAVVS